MVALLAEHDLIFRRPWYAGGRNVALHRYFDAGFIDRFRSDVANNPGPALLTWQRDDVDGSGTLKLRRPLHRTFHIVAAEIACKMPGAPAVEPAKIASSGFVLRWYDDGGREQGFQLVRGRPLGWQPVDDPKADPDMARRARLYGITLPPAPAATYTGEEVHPLHPLLVEPANDRPHTLLFGYLPIGGAEFLPPSPAAAPPDLPDEVPWPFGIAGRSVDPPPWSLDLAWQMRSGTVQPALAAVLRLLLTRYGFADPSTRASNDNGPILAVLGRMGFFAGDGPSSGFQAVAAWAAAHPMHDANGAPLTLALWLGQVDLGTLLNVLMAGDLKSPVTLPPGLVPQGGGNLLVAEDAAAALLTVLKTRCAAAWIDNVSQFPVPKYAVGTGRKFYVKPFARVIRPDGCERLCWGASSEQFLLASPFDPDATRPVMIQMPALSDAKRGMARGAAFMMPPDLADFVNRLTNKDAVQNELNGPPPSTGLGIGFICSFSIPVITICAMLLLSIIIALLNIVFFWLPFVKICLPVPRNMRGLQ